MSYPNYPPGGGYPPQSVRYCNGIDKHARRVLNNRVIRLLEALTHLALEEGTHRLLEEPIRPRADFQEDLQDSACRRDLTNHVRNSTRDTLYTILNQECRMFVFYIMKKSCFD